jgi:hypothetical protein
VYEEEEHRTDVRFGNGSQGAGYCCYWKYHIETAHHPLDWFQRVGVAGHLFCDSVRLHSDCLHSQIGRTMTMAPSTWQKYPFRDATTVARGGGVNKDSPGVPLGDWKTGIESPERSGI